MRKLNSWTAMLPVALAVLSGCDDVGSGGDAPEQRPTLVQLLEESAALGNEIDEARLDYTDPSTLPVEGTARYEGVIGIDSFGSSGAPEFMAGELTLVADFGNDDDVLSGSAENFVAEGGREMDGSLDIGMGGLDRDVDPNGGGWTYIGEIDGTLTGPGGNEFDYSGAVLGDFLGEDHGYTTGNTEGLVRGPGGNGTFEGGFVAER